MAKITVTGGAGYLGSVMVPTLLSQGHEVTVVDRLIYRQNSLLEVCANPKFKFVYADVRDPDTMKAAIKGAEWIIPLAAIVGARPSEMDKEYTWGVNTRAIELITKLREPNQKIIFPTTNSGYGIGQQHAFCTEESPLLPLSTYGKSKVDAEKILLESGNAITLRLATLFGFSPRFRRDLLVNDFVHRAVKDRFIVLFESHFRRNFLHIRDAVGAFTHCMENFERMKDEPYNVGLSNANLSKKQLCEKIKEHVPEFYIVEAEVGSDPDKRDYIVSNEKIEKTGWRPRHSLDDGIRELIKGYQILFDGAYSNA